jgi:hypothetical protein
MSETQTWWCTERLCTKPAPVDVDRSTERSIWVSGRRRQRLYSEWGSYYPTREEALEHMAAEARETLDALKRKTHEASTRLGQIESELRRETEP